MAIFDWYLTDRKRFVEKAGIRKSIAIKNLLGFGNERFRR